MTRLLLGNKKCYTDYFDGWRCRLIYALEEIISSYGIYFGKIRL